MTYDKTSPLCGFTSKLMSGSAVMHVIRRCCVLLLNLQWYFYINMGSNDFLYDVKASDKPTPNFSLYQLVVLVFVCSFTVLDQSKCSGGVLGQNSLMKSGHWTTFNDVVCVCMMLILHVSDIVFPAVLVWQDRRFVFCTLGAAWKLFVKIINK